MPPSHPKLPAPPQPTRIFFDPFNSSSTGHQRAENRLSGSTSWRESRTRKLRCQFGDATGAGGSEHLSDLVGAGSEDWRRDGRKENGDWEVGAPGLRESGWQDIRGLLGNPRKRRSDDDDEGDEGEGDGVVDDFKKKKKEKKKKKRRASKVDGGVGNEEDVISASRTKNGSALVTEQLLSKSATISAAMIESTSALPLTSTTDKESTEPDLPPQIFRGLTMYLNGSTMPLVSDHRLKRLFAQHGGNSSISLGRRTVTHVILGERCGGGLASGKLQKENQTVRGKGIKYVSAKWVLDSVEKRIRQPEHKYAAVEIKGKLGGSGQRSVAGLFKAKSA